MDKHKLITLQVLRNLCKGRGSSRCFVPDIPLCSGKRQDKVHHVDLPPQYVGWSCIFHFVPSLPPFNTVHFTNTWNELIEIVLNQSVAGKRLVVPSHAFFPPLIVPYKPDCCTDVWREFYPIEQKKQYFFLPANPYTSSELDIRALP